jgi:DNA-binding SARP family transcriptional activator
VTRSTNAQRDAQQASPAELPRVDFRLLGPLEALVDGAPVRLGSPKQRALLTHLLLHANEAVPIERLIDELWPEGPPEKARHAIQVYVSRLRKALGGPRIEAHARAYRLSVEDADIDLAEFRRLVAKGRAGLEKDMESAAGQLHRALALWRGQALADLDG